MVKKCQVCNAELSHNDLSVDTYVKICQNCWKQWEKEAGEPMRRYGKPGGNSVCTACGMVFGGVFGFEIHRKGMRCNPPNFQVKRNLSLKDGIWVRKISSEMPKFHSGVAISGVFPESPTQGHPDQ